MSTDQNFLSKPQERYGEFVVKSCRPIAELKCVLRELEHLPSGAQVMHIENEDPENLFCLSFKTFPASSNGAPHILEHTVLCGSEKFPVKDPFFGMTRRSLNTFMNALTGSDFTCYPAASQNRKDFYNLFAVYSDAVFHPQLKRMSFLQEGHRLEFTNPQDPKTPLQIRGIVFNEMKGNLASADSRLWHALMEALVPDLPYAYNSGGDPKVIPSLTYEELVAFHQTYYHPSQCLFFFYGDFPLKGHLDVLENEVLKDVKKREPLQALVKQKRFSAPIQKEGQYPALPSEAHQCIVTFGFLTTEATHQEEMLALGVLDSILMEDDASLLKSALLNSKLCTQVDAYMDTDMSEVPYAIVCRGCDPSQVEELEKTFREALRTIVKEGIPWDTIEGALHQLEFSRLEISADHAPFGLSLFMRAALATQRGCSAHSALVIYAIFEELLQKCKQPTMLTSLIEKYFVNNPHQVRLIMRPNSHLVAQEMEAEKQSLSALQKTLSDKEAAQIVKQTEELLSFQKQVEGQSLNCLPKITLHDVAPEVRLFPLAETELGHLKIFHHRCFTNHIIYADLLFDFPHVEEADLPYVYLLVSLLPELGCGDRTYERNLRYIQSHTGDLSASCSLNVQTQHPQLILPSLGLKGKALTRNAPHLFKLMQEMLQHPRFNDKKRIEELLKQLHESHTHQLNRKALRYATHLATSGMSAVSHVHELWHGLEYVKFIEFLNKEIHSHLGNLVDRLIHLKNQLFTFHNLHLVLSCSQESFNHLQENRYFGLCDLCSTVPFTPLELNRTPPHVVSQAREISSQVAFTAEAFKVVPYMHTDSSALYVATALFNHKILHPKIREQGGAYGSDATYQSTLGQLHFSAYRDPHLASTLNTFSEAIETIAHGRFSAQDLEEAKLNLLQQFDSPIPPSSRALIAYSWQRDGKTPELRQAFRDSFLALTPEQVKQAVASHLLSQKQSGTIVSFAGKELLERENKGLALQGKALPVLPI